MKRSPKKQVARLLKNAKKALRPKKTVSQKNSYLKKQAKKMDKKPTGPEILFANLLEEIGVEYETQKIIGGKIFDFYVPEFNTIIEVDGIYWHAKGKKIIEMNSMQKRAVNNDRKKDVIAKGNGFKIERVWEDDLNDNYIQVKKRFENILT